MAQEFRRVCTTANLATCVPECNAVTYGFLLSIEIDGKGTVSRAAVTPLAAYPPLSPHESHGTAYLLLTRLSCGGRR